MILTQQSEMILTQQSEMILTQQSEMYYLKRMDDVLEDSQLKS